MLKPITLSVVCFFIIYISPLSVSAQTSVDSSENKKIAYTNIQEKFYKAIGEQSRLYNGIEYNGYDRKFLGNAGFMDIVDLHKGSVIYDGYLYKNVDMFYDIYQDEVIIQLYQSFLKINLLSEKVDSFDLLDHHFIRIKNNPAVATSLKTGFYDELYGGKIQVLARRTKSIQRKYDIGGSIDSYFSSSVDYYLFKNGEYYNVNSQGAFLNALKDKKKDIQQFIKANKIKIRKTQEESMVKIAAYYDHITE